MAAEHDADSGGPESGFEITAHFVTVVTAAAYERDAPTLRRIVRRLHPADLADLLEQLPDEALRRLVALVGPELPAEVLPELESGCREVVVSLLPADFVGRALAELDTDDAALVAGHLDEARLEEALAAADADTRHAVEQGLAAGDETAGRLMQRELVAAPEFWTVGDAIDHMRAAESQLPDVFFEIFVVDPAYRPIGSVPLSTLLRSGRDTPLSAIMRPPQAIITATMDQEEVAYLFRKYHLASAAVVDDAGRITGMMTVDDIVDIVQVESEEDLLRLSGVGQSEGAVTFASAVRARAPWLGLNVLTGLASATIIALFGASIEQIVALAVLMPIVASLGGNAGTQALAVAVRALAARDLTPSTATRHILRELFTGMINGVIMACLLATVAQIWFGSAGLSLAVGLSVAITLSLAGLVGILVPLTLRRFGADPAVSSSVFVTFATDFIGFLAFLGLATAILL